MTRLRVSVVDFLNARPLTWGLLHDPPPGVEVSRDTPSACAAPSKAGIGKLGTHSLRHSYRSWLDAVGTAIAVQQKLMRHSDIRTTMNIYGDVVTDEMGQAHSKVVGLALSRPLN